MTTSSEVEIAVLILEEQRETNRLLKALIDALAEEMPEEEQPATTYMDGSAVR